MEQFTWNLCSNTLPKRNQKVLVQSVTKEITVGVYTHWGWSFSGQFDKPYAWMNLPEPIPVKLE